MQTAFGYIRVSGDNQELSLKTQREQLLRYYQVNLSEGYKWGDIYADPATSGKINFADRDGGARLLLKVGRGDCILFTKVDRAGRSVRDMANLIHTLEQRGIRTIFLDMGGQAVDTSTQLGKFVLWMMAFIAEWEAARIVERRRDVKVQADKEGRAVNGFPPWGLKVISYNNQKWVIPDVQRLTIVRWIDEASRSGMTYEQISDALNGNAVQPLNGKRSKWDRNHVMNQLMQYRNRIRKEARLGADGETTWLMHNGKIWSVDDFHPPIANILRRHIAAVKKFTGATEAAESETIALDIAEAEG